MLNRQCNKVLRISERSDKAGTKGKHFCTKDVSTRDTTLHVSNMSCLQLPALKPLARARRVAVRMAPKYSNAQIAKLNQFQLRQAVGDTGLTVHNTDTT